MFQDKYFQSFRNVRLSHYVLLSESLFLYNLGFILAILCFAHTRTIRFSSQDNSQQMLTVLLYSVNDEARKERGFAEWSVRCAVTFTAPSSIKTRSWHPASSLRRKFESSRICIRTRELPRASREGRIAGKLIKSAPRTFIIDVLTITNVIVLFLNKAFSILRSFRY